jgi:hypothetical protein
VRILERDYARRAPSKPKIAIFQAGPNRLQALFRSVSAATAGLLRLNFGYEKSTSLFCPKIGFLIVTTDNAASPHSAATAPFPRSPFTARLSIPIIENSSAAPRPAAE